MCGIAGVMGGFAPDSRRKFLNSLSAGLAHRGPDGCQTYEDDHAGLVHTRLSIIDLSAQGNQPFYNEDRSVVLICNGEIYNYKQLRNELEANGHQFNSASDSEVIVHLYEDYRDQPEKLLLKLTGMFAFAIWDINARKLLLARDRIGIKPLYFSVAAGKLVFSSEVQPIVNTGIWPFDLDHTSLYEYFLLGSIPGPNTLYKEIQCLDAGTYLTAENGNVNITTYWDVPENDKHVMSEGEAQEELEALFTAIITDHLVADVPVGTFLSAGVDSSLISAIAVEQHPGINSFTASFPGEPEDEGVTAAETALKLGTTHFAYALTSNFFDDFEHQFRNMDQPYANPSALALGRISKLARQQVKVVLSGDGGDELFGGYNRHEFPKTPAFLRYIPRALQNDLLKIGSRVTGNKGLETLRKNIARTDVDIFMHKVALEKTQIILSMFAPEIAPKIDIERYSERVKKLYKRRQGADRLNNVLYVDMKTTLVDEMLTKCDRMTMQNGIEGRLPFLDHRLVEFAFNLPGDYKRKNGTGKIMLRNFLAKKLGRELAFREKTGFKSPFKHWMNTDKATHDFVVHNITEAKQIQLLNSKRLETIIGDLDCVTQETVFALVCLNTFCKNAPLL